MKFKQQLQEVWIQVGLILAIGLTLTGFACALVNARNERQVNNALQDASQMAQRYVLERMSYYQYGLRGVRGAVMVAGEQEFDHTLFLRYLQGRDSESEFVGAHGFGFIRRVPEAQLAQFQAKTKAELAIDFNLRQFEPHAGERYVIQYVEPLELNASGMGMDIASEPQRRAAAQTAMRTGQPAMTAPVALRLNQGVSSPAALLFLPIYREASTPTDSVMREQSLVGWSFTSLIMDEVLGGVVVPSGSQLRIRDVTDAGQAVDFFSAGKVPDERGRRQRIEDAYVYGRQWQFDMVTGPGFEAALQLPAPFMVFLGGSLFTLALCGWGYLLSMSSIRRRRLMQMQLRLGAIVESSTDGIISKDLNGVVTSWNKGAEGIFGYSAEEAVGKRLDTLIIEPSRIVEEQRILRKIRKGEYISNFDTVRRRKDGTSVDVSVNVSPILGPGGEVTGASKTVRDITRQKQAEARILELNAGLEVAIAERTRQLRSTNLMLTSVLRAATEVAIIVTGSDGLIRVFNAGAERMLGYTAGQVVGLCTPKMFHVPEELEQQAAHDKLAGARATDDDFDTLVRQCRTDGASTRQWTFVRQDGSRFPVTLMVTEIRDEEGDLTGYLGIAVDITSAQAAQQELTAARDHLLMAAEVAQLGIWSWDIERNELQWNDRMFEFYDQPKRLRDTGLTYEHWLEKVHPDDRREASRRLMAIIRGESVQDQTFRVLAADGRERIIQSGAHLARDREGKPVRVTGINLDITAQRQLQARLLDAKEKADAASAAKSSFLANMSHEIRTPLNAVLGMLQLLDRAGLDGRQAGYVANARTAARSLLSLLNDILDYSKIEAGKLQLEVHGFDLDQLLRELAIVLAGNQANKEVQILFEIDPQMSLHLKGDSLRLQQVLINLAGNALKFTERGQVVVRIAPLAVHADALRLRFEVQDTGIGISPQHLEHIFEGFIQAQASTTRRYGGTGLGLAICRRLVSLMGGELQVHSELGQGSCFWFEIDLELDNAFSTGNHARTSNRVLRVLVVDDNDVARQILTRMIHGLGWQVDAVSSGREALAQVRDQQVRGAGYDAVLMDWSMPEMDGVTAARGLLEACESCAAPAVIMVTAYPQEALGQLEAGERAPFLALLSKPVTPLQLAQVVRKAVAPAWDATSTPPESMARIQALDGVRVLVVEDNALNREVASELLGQEGARVYLANGGLEGVARLTVEGLQVDAVLMDIQMPDIDGFEATRRLRADPRFASLPIIAMTANASADDRKASLAVGMNAHLAKPIDLATVIATLRPLAHGPIYNPAVIAPTSSGTLEPLPVLLARFGGNRRLLASLAARFGTQTQALLMDLRHAVEGGDHGGPRGHSIASRVRLAI
ncbi:PAS domain S-box protein [Pseudomonas sp. TE3610]